MRVGVVFYREFLASCAVLGENFIVRLLSLAKYSFIVRVNHFGIAEENLSERNYYMITYITRGGRLEGSRARFFFLHSFRTSYEALLLF